MICQKEDLVKIRKENKNKKIVVALGSFDLFHYEHLRYLSDAKKLGDILVVGVKNDKAVSIKDKFRPIINQEWRTEIVDALKCVDYTFLCKENNQSNSLELFENNESLLWWNLFTDLFENLNPDILYFEKNEKLQKVRIKASKIYKFNLVSRERTEIISTSKIINKIKNN